MDIGVTESGKTKLERSRLKWASQAEKKEMKIWQRADAHKVVGKMKRGRTRLQ